MNLWTFLSVKVFCEFLHGLPDNRFNSMVCVIVVFIVTAAITIFAWIQRGG